MPIIRQARTKVSIVYFLINLTLIFSTGCFHEFYKFEQSDLIALNQFVQEDSTQQYYIVHHRGISMQLKDHTIQNGNLKATLAELQMNRESFIRNHKKFIDTKKTPTYRRYRPHEKDFLQGVHLFLDDKTPILLQGDSIDLPLNFIDEVQIFKKDKRETALSHFGGVVGVLLPILTVLGLLRYRGDI